MKHTFIMMAAALALSVTGSAQAGDHGHGHQSSASGTHWRYVVDTHAWSGVPETDARRSGQVTQWNISSPHRASASASRSSGYVRTPAPRYSGAGTYQVPAGTIPGAGGAGSLGVPTAGNGVTPSPN
ncbi:MAG: hypothetical protein V4662_04970 [Verrucomicrobiota bacterium]